MCLIICVGNKQFCCNVIPISYYCLLGVVDEEDKLKEEHFANVWR